MIKPMPIIKKDLPFSPAQETRIKLQMPIGSTQGFFKELTAIKRPSHIWKRRMTILNSPMPVLAVFC